MSKVLIYSQEDLDLILELEKTKNEELQQENQQLKLINKEYERLNKENGRGFTITSVQQYNIDELIKYKENWNELKGTLEYSVGHNDRGREYFEAALYIMKELERGVSDAED